MQSESIQTLENFVAAKQVQSITKLNKPTTVFCEDFLEIQEGPKVPDVRSSSRDLSSSRARQGPGGPSISGAAQTEKTTRPQSTVAGAATQHPATGPQVTVRGSRSRTHIGKKPAIV